MARPSLPETRSSVIDTDIEVKEHWALDPNSPERKELAITARALGVGLADPDTFTEIFSVERLHHFPGSVEDAKRRVIDYALKRESDLLDRLRFPGDVHHEARVVAWTYIVAPNGQQINVTAREGANADTVASTVLALTGAVRILEEVGFVALKK